MLRALLLLVALLVGALFNQRTEASFPPHGGGGTITPPGYQGVCDVISAGCGEYWAQQWAEFASYSGPLLQITNTTNSQTMDIPQTNHHADISGVAAFCGTNTTTNGITTYLNCVISKRYAQSHGHANDKVPSVFVAPNGPDCSAGGNTCSCPFAIEVATGLPFLQSVIPCEYTLVGDGNLVGVTGGTSSVSVIYEGIAKAAQECCGAVGLGHAYNVTDVIGTTFYLGAPQGQASGFFSNQCQTPSGFCLISDQESIGDAVDYSPTNIGSILAAISFNSVTNKVSGYINGGLLRSPITPAAALCQGCGGINLPLAAHDCGGGDLSQPADCQMRGNGFTNAVLSQSDITATYNLIKARNAGLLTFTDFIAPTTAVTVIQVAPGAQNSGSGATTKSISFSAPTGTGKRGVVVGLFWCTPGGCSSNTADVFAAGSVTAGGNACTEAPNSFKAGPLGFQTEAWVCPNLTSPTTTVTVTTDGTSVGFLGVLATEINAPTSGGVIDQGGSGSATATWYCNATTNGNTTQSGEFLYSIGASASPGGIFVRGTGLNTTLTTTLQDEYVATGPSGRPYSASWLQGTSNAPITCSGVAIEP